MKKKKHVKDSATSGFLTPLLTKGQYKKEINQRTRLEFNPLERSIQGDLAGSASRQNEIPGWFQQYQDKVSGAAATTAAAYDKANAGFQQQSQNAQANDTASRQDMQQKASSDAALRGVPMDYNGAQAALEAANARNNVQAGFAGTVGVMGANQAGYLADKGRIGTGEMINQLFKEQTRERGIRSDMRALAQKKGDYASQLASDLRESDRKYQLGQQTLKGENSRAQLSANTSSANNKRTTSTSRLNAQLSAATSAGNARLAAKIRKQIARQSEQGQNARNTADNVAAKERAKINAKGNKNKKKKNG